MNGAVAAAGGDMAKAALAAGLVDRIGDRRAFEARLAAARRRATERAPGGYSGSSSPPTSPTRSSAAERPDRHRHHRRQDRRRQGRARHRRRRHHRQRRSRTGSATRASRRWSSASTARAARCSRRSASARRCSPPRRKKMPVVVSMGSVAASGGYWVATPADYIFAEPSTITGSIGVFGVLPSFQGTLQKLGIGADGVKTTPLSGEPDLLGPLARSRPADPDRRRGDLSPLPRHRRRSRGTRRPPTGRPDRPGPRVGRRHRAPAWPGRRLRRDERGDRQGGRSWPSSATSAASATSSRRRASATS